VSVLDVMVLAGRAKKNGLFFLASILRALTQHSFIFCLAPEMLFVLVDEKNI